MSSVHNFHRDFLWRVAGFPCEDLEQFGLDILADEIMAIMSSSDADNWSSWWVGHEQLLVEHRLRDRFALQFNSLRTLLGVVAHQQRFQSAVAYSSPAAANLLWCHFSTPSVVRNSKSKRRELLAMRYLQRFVTKCETAAFVGPTATGRITRAPNRVDYRFDPADYEPATFVSTRVLAQLGRHLRREPRVLTNLWVRRRSGTSLLGGSVVSHPAVGVIELGPECLEVLRATARPKRVYELCQSIESRPDDLAQVVYSLLWLGLLTDELDALPQTASPLTTVGQLITDAGVALALEAHLVRVLDAALNSWGKAGAAERLVLLAAIDDAMSATGMVSPAREGQFYADALPMVEDGACAASTLCLDEKWAEPVLGELEMVLRRTLRHRVPTSISDIAARLRTEHAGHAPLGSVFAWSEACTSVRIRAHDPTGAGCLPVGARCDQPGHHDRGQGHRRYP